MQSSTSSSKRILSIVLVTGILIGVLFLSINHVQNETEKKIRELLITSTLEKQQETTKRTASHISSDFELISNKMGITATSLSSGDFSSKPVLDSLMKLYSELNSKTIVNWIFILNDKGMSVSSINSYGAMIHTNKIDLSYRDYFINTKTTLEPYLTNGFIGINNVPIIISAYPILNSDGKFIGMIAAAIDTNNFFKQYGNINDPDGELLVVIGNDKKFITNPNSELIGKNVLEKDSLKKLDKERTKFFENLFSENSASAKYEFENMKKIAYGDAVTINGKIQYYIFDSIFIEKIYQQTTSILEQEKFSTVLIILLLAITSGTVIIFFEKLKIKEQKEKNVKLMTIGEFSARLAHDLRNPLAVMKMSLDLIKHSSVDSKVSDPIVTERMDMIQNSINRITHQVDDVLGFVKNSPPKFTKASLNQIVRNSLKKVHIPNNVEIKVSDKDARIDCDSIQLETVFINLILNSIQAMPKGGKIEITIYEKDDTVILQFTDSGKGIPKENLNKIFEPLFTTKQEGTGLGLAGVKTIIEAHGGTVSVTSHPTTFRITLQKKHLDQFSD